MGADKGPRRGWTSASAREAEFSLRLAKRLATGAAVASALVLACCIGACLVPARYWYASYTLDVHPMAPLPGRPGAKE
jgi:hypothetical protein